MIKQISDLSVAELSDLNLSCKFVMDDSNKKTKQISFGIVESKLSSEIQKSVENSFDDKLDIFLEKLSSIIKSEVINSGGTANFLDYGKTLNVLLEGYDSISSTAMPCDCQIQFTVHTSEISYGFSISVDNIRVGSKFTEAYTTYRESSSALDRYYPWNSMYYYNVAYGQKLYLFNDISNSITFDIIPYRYGRSDISTLNFQELSGNSVLPITRCFYAGKGSGLDISGLTQLTQLSDFERTDIQWRGKNYIIIIELSASEDCIGNFSKLFAYGDNLKPTSKIVSYTVSNTILPGSTSWNTGIGETFHIDTVSVPKGKFLYLKCNLTYYPRDLSFNDIVNGIVQLTPHLQIKR